MHNWNFVNLIYADKCKCCRAY